MGTRERIARAGMLPKAGFFSTATMLAAVFATAQAQAAAISDSCCFDLETRVAELEATTARTTNRNVSLTISGWVNEAVFFWDDGTESDVYVGTNALEQDRFRFVGQAKIQDGWWAGYTIESGVRGASSRDFSQSETGNSYEVNMRKASWWIKNEILGEVRVGRDGTATYHLLDDADATQSRNFSDAEAAPIALGSFNLRINGVLQSLTWREILAQAPSANTPGQSALHHLVRYDSPTIAGVTLTASWAEDDQWGVKFRYEGSVGDFALLAQAGYGQSTDEQSATCNPVPPLSDTHCEWWGAAGTILHEPTGLFAYGGYGGMTDNAVKSLDPSAIADDSIWFIQAGIEKKWTPTGTTTVFGEFRHDNVGSNLGADITIDGQSGYVKKGDYDFWAAGVIQSIDAADMYLYAIYRHSDGELTNSSARSTELDSFQMVIAGAFIQF